MNLPTLTTLELLMHDQVLEVRLNRPDKSNSLNDAMWQEIRQAFDWADGEAGVRAIVLSGAGKHFCSGIDLAMLGSVMARVAHADEARGREALRRLILDLQDCLTAVERCRKPVLAAIQGACLGGGLDLAVCCDMRYASSDAQFAVREIDIGMVADVGVLQRLPKLISEGLARELAYTGRNLGADDAKACGLVNAVWPEAESLRAGVLQIAAQIAAKSPLSVRGSKEILNYSRDHSVADGLNYVATWNAAMLLSADLKEAMTASREKRAPQFLD